MKNLLFVLFFLISIYSKAQYGVPHEFGKPFPQEIALTVYDKDPTARAVILYEKGEYKFGEEGEHNLVRINLYRKTYRKIKILNDEAKDYYTTVKITIRGNNRDEEWVSNIRAVTTNSGAATYLNANAIHTKPLGNDYYEITFTMPNVQKGSIIEYEYTINSPNPWRLNGWEFQHAAPTVYSEFNAEIPGFYNYTRVMIGDRPLDVNHAEIKKFCFHFANNKNTAECEVLTYAMKDIPAFTEEEYMLSPYNYLYRIDFQLERMISQDGSRHLFTKDWKSVDQEFRSNKNIGQQLNRKSYFKSALPQNILTIPDKLERAKAVYNYIQNHFTRSNHSLSIFHEFDVKKAYENKSGKIPEINMALINALEAADIEAYIAFSSTRENGLPTKRNAVMTDFNYLMALATINGQNYFLDASNKFYPFGIVPFNTLNYDARIMDFKKGSYWEIIKANPANTEAVTVQLKVDENFNISGQLREANIGYFGGLKREELNQISNDNYLRKKEATIADLEIISNKVSNTNDPDKPLIEDYEILLHTEGVGNIILNPFIFKYLSENPFKLTERSYPVDFGFARKSTYTLSLDLAGKYTIENLPENKAFALSDGAGSVSVNYSLTNDVLQMRYDFQLNQVHFLPESYEGLKDFFGNIVQIQNNHPVILKKIDE